MIKTLPVRISPLALMLPVFLGMIAFASMRPVEGGTPPSAFAAQNANKSAATKGTKAAPTKVDCSKADDAALADQIKERLSKLPSLKNEKDIKVDVKDRVATLSGKIGSKSHRATAAAEAKKVKCVKSVVNNINPSPCNCSANEYCCNGACQTQPCPMKPKKPKK